MFYKQYAIKQSPNFKPIKKQNELIVIHYTAGIDSLPWLTNPESQASAHFLIGREGKVTQLVDTDHIAWHAGVSEWMGRKSCNNFSVGIELENRGKMINGGFEEFYERQLAAMEELIGLLLKDNDSIVDIVGHQDIAPGRKIDPGPRFPWDRVEAFVSHFNAASGRNVKVRGKLSL